MKTASSVGGIGTKKLRNECGETFGCNVCVAAAAMHSRK